MTDQQMTVQQALALIEGDPQPGYKEAAKVLREAIEQSEKMRSDFQPFAEAISLIPHDWRDTAPIFIECDYGHNPGVQPTAGQLREVLRKYYPVG